jgi:LysM repeat protein
MKKILTIIIVVVALQLGVVSLAAASGGSYHKVYYGETLYSIARQYHADPYHIADVNGLYNPDHIYAGQVLYIPESNYGHDYGSGYDDGQYHKVHYGDTLYSIGRKYDANPYHIADVNGLYNPNYIYAGQLLHIPADSSYPGYGHNNDYDKHHNNHHGSNHHDQGSNYHNNQGSYGYDYTGYYYDRGGKRYSHTCGYYNNCW